MVIGFGQVFPSRAAAKRYLRDLLRKTEVGVEVPVLLEALPHFRASEGAPLPNRVEVGGSLGEKHFKAVWEDGKEAPISYHKLASSLESVGFDSSQTQTVLDALGLLPYEDGLKELLMVFLSLMPRRGSTAEIEGVLPALRDISKAHEEQVGGLLGELEKEGRLDKIEVGGILWWKVKETS